MEPLSTVLSVTEGRGPSPSFEKAHVALSILIIGESGSMGRQSLAARTRLGGGAVRTLIKHLRTLGVVDADPSGCHLTSAGRSLYRSLRALFPSRALLQGRGPTDATSQFCILVRGAGSKVRSGIEQRDAAIRVGALGATTYLIKGSKFGVPGGSADCERDFPELAWKEVRRALVPKNGDALIIAGSDDTLTAELGSVAAALTLA